MIEGFKHADLNKFQSRPGWGALDANEKSLFEAYLRRTEDWTITDFLRAIGREATIAAATLRPLPPVTVPTPPPSTPVPTPVPVVATTAPPSFHTITPPSWEELEELHAKWDRDWKRSNRSGSKGKEEDDSDTVTLTREEIQTATMLGRQWSAENSGHGRAAHGGYASSSSSYTMEQDRQRSEQVAIQREIDKALLRKRKTGSAFNK